MTWVQYYRSIASLQPDSETRKNASDIFRKSVILPTLDILQITTTRMYFAIAIHRCKFYHHVIMKNLGSA